jgi:hypothetical protein
MIEYNNKQLREELLPLYDRMLQIFTEQYWLAEPATRAHYDELVRFVELWHRHFEKSLPTPVLVQLKHSEGALAPLYENLTTTLDSLTARLRGP